MSHYGGQAFETIAVLKNKYQKRHNLSSIDTVCEKKISQDL